MGQGNDERNHSLVFDSRAGQAGDAGLSIFLFFCGQTLLYFVTNQANLRGRVKFPTGGITTMALASRIVKPATRFTDFCLRRGYKPARRCR